MPPTNTPPDSPIERVMKVHKHGHNDSYTIEYKDHRSEKYTAIVTAADATKGVADHFRSVKPSGEPTVHLDIHFKRKIGHEERLLHGNKVSFPYEQVVDARMTCRHQQYRLSSGGEPAPSGVTMDTTPEGIERNPTVFLKDDRIYFVIPVKEVRHPITVHMEGDWDTVSEYLKNHGKVHTVPKSRHINAHKVIRTPTFNIEVKEVSPGWANQRSPQVQQAPGWTVDRSTACFDLRFVENERSEMELRLHIQPNGGRRIDFAKRRSEALHFIDQIQI
ncbi:MAG: hypothetical protein CYPHOPRED_000732 [Cyphobasidiales sp. Tagirdzhanova-0007]|nr:MAG: hypothetical protein CYPHOPRED_000732 [Cyphobasidiales sp. Tagirdzhanova-0007]